MSNVEKKNIQIPDKILQKFLNLNMKNIFTRSQERDLFLAYCIKMKIDGCLKIAS